MKLKSFIKKAAALGTLLPTFVFAAGFDATYLTNFMDQIKRIMQAVVPLLITAAIIVFFYEIVQFIKSKDKGDSTKVEAARNGILWSVGAIFLMLSFFGIIRIFQGITGTQNRGNINAADVPLVTF